MGQHETRGWWRGARSVVAVVWANGAEVTAEGRLNGTIARKRAGIRLRLDRVFEVAGKTLDEIGPEAKDTLSHRAQGLRALAALLQEGRGDKPRD